MDYSQAPPPPYNDVTETETTVEKPFSEEKAPSYDAACPSSSPNGSPSRGIRRVRFDYEGWRARNGTVTDADTSQILYTSEHRYRKPTFALNSPDGHSIATASSHLITNKFDCEIAGQKFELTPRNKLGQTATYNSPTFGQQLTWQRGSCWSSGMRYTLLDANAAPIARFLGGAGTKSMPWGSFGDLEFANGRGLTDAQRDEVVATGLALAYRAAMNHNAGMSSAVAS